MKKTPSYMDGNTRDPRNPDLAPEEARKLGDEEDEGPRRAPAVEDEPARPGP